MVTLDQIKYDSTLLEMSVTKKCNGPCERRLESSGFEVRKQNNVGDFIRYTTCIECRKTAKEKKSANSQKTNEDEKTRTCTKCKVVKDILEFRERCQGKRYLRCSTCKPG